MRRITPELELRCFKCHKVTNLTGTGPCACEHCGTSLLSTDVAAELAREVDGEPDLRERH